jgi:CRISPR/Cas system-associated exonuclease Cas4 (RecB family)
MVICWHWRKPPDENTRLSHVGILKAQRQECQVLRRMRLTVGLFAVILERMSDVTCILQAIEQGDPQAAEQLLPLVYDELRRLAAEKLAHEKPGQTLQATALVHEAYLRLVDGEKARLTVARSLKRSVLLQERAASKTAGQGSNPCTPAWAEVGGTLL